MNRIKEFVVVGEADLSLRHTPVDLLARADESGKPAYGLKDIKELKGGGDFVLIGNPETGVVTQIPGCFVHGIRPVAHSGTKYRVCLKTGRPVR